MNRNRLRLTTVLCGLALAVPLTLACGDKVAALGGGVPFERLQAVRLTGQVVLLMSPASGVRRIDDAAGLAKALAFAGHSVRIVDNAEMLQTELRVAPANVVIADQGEAARVAAGMRSLASPPALLIVVSAQNADAGGRRADAACLIRADLHQSRSVVRSVDQLVARQSRGARADCLPTA